MSENENETQPEQPNTQPEGAKPKTAAQGVLDVVTEVLRNAGPDIVARLKQAMIDREVNERVVLLDKAFAKRLALQNELQKVNRPDSPEQFDADGARLSGTYSKARVKEIKDAKEALQRFENGLEKALNNDFSKLKELLAKS